MGYIALGPHPAESGNVLSQASQCGDVAFRHKVSLGGLQLFSFVPVQFCSCGCWLSFGLQLSLQCRPTGSYCQSYNLFKGKSAHFGFWQLWCATTS